MQESRLEMYTYVVLNDWVVVGWFGVGELWLSYMLVCMLITHQRQLAAKVSL